MHDPQDILHAARAVRREESAVAVVAVVCQARRHCLQRTTAG